MEAQQSVPPRIEDVAIAKPSCTLDKKIKMDSMNASRCFTLAKIGSFSQKQGFYINNELLIALDFYAK